MRADNDSWDLASSVGATATMVAASRALASRGDKPLINDPFAEPLVRAVGIDFFTQILDGKIPDEAPDYNPQQSGEHLGVRTRFYDDFFLNAARGGVQQFVILAAGLDTRAYRLPWPAGSTVYEVDLPDVLNFKSTTLERLDAQPTAAHRTVGIDLRDDWPAALAAAGFTPAVPTAWSAEGLLVYLPSDAQDGLFDRITSISAPGSHLAFDYAPDMTVFSGDEAQERWNRTSINIGELVYHGERTHAPDHVSAQGWRTSSRTARDLYVTNGLEYPDEETFAAFAEYTYVSAQLDH